MKKLKLDEIKEIELEILLTFDKFCKENGLKYYLAGGTLLGAIRHKGFIPWDDDIDVCMPREDYERFLNLYIDEKKYVLVSNSIGNFTAPFGGLQNAYTKVVSDYSEGESKLWIDIFPVDGLSENLDEVKRVYKKCTFYRKILLLASAKIGEGKTIFNKYIKYILKPIAMFYGKQRCVKNIEKIAAQYPYDESKYVGIVTWGLYGAGERMLKSEFEKSIEVEFEGHKFPAFSCWDSYLRGLYGDYMQLPPIEKRKSHDMVAYLIEEDVQ